MEPSKLWLASGLGLQIIRRTVLRSSAVSDLRASFCNQVILLLENLEIPGAFIQEVKSEISAISIGVADSQRMLALLRDASYYFQESADFIPPDRIRNQIEMEIDMADWLYGPPLYQRPIDLLHELVQEVGGESACNNSLERTQFVAGSAGFVTRSECMRIKRRVSGASQRR